MEDLLAELFKCIFEMLFETIGEAVLEGICTLLEAGSDLVETCLESSGPSILL